MSKHPDYNRIRELEAWLADEAGQLREAEARWAATETTPKKTAAPELPVKLAPVKQPSTGLLWACVTKPLVALAVAIAFMVYLMGTQATADALEVGFRAVGQGFGVLVGGR